MIVLPVVVHMLLVKIYEKISQHGKTAVILMPSSRVTDGTEQFFTSTLAPTAVLFQNFPTLGLIGLPLKLLKGTDPRRYWSYQVINGYIYIYNMCAVHPESPRPNKEWSLGWSMQRIPTTNGQCLVFGPPGYIVDANALRRKRGPSPIMSIFCHSGSWKTTHAHT